MAGNSRDQRTGISLVDLKQQIIARLDIPRFYAKYITYGPTDNLYNAADGDGWSERVFCPIHNDTGNPQFFINQRDGHFKCHACGAGGSAFDFYMLKNNLNVKDGRQFWQAVVALATEAGLDISTYNKSKAKPETSRPGTELSPVNLPAGLVSQESLQAVAGDNNIPKESATEAHDRKHKPLNKEHYRSFCGKLEAKHFRYLAEKRGFTMDSIKEWEIGWNPEALFKDANTGKWDYGRLTIPVLDKDGNCRNIRQYNMRADSNSKMVNFVLDKDKDTEVRFGKPARLFGIHKLYQGNFQHVVICEGEWDCILLNQKFKMGGYNTWVAVTGTAGANTFRPEWLDCLEGKTVYLCLDCDEAGKVAAADLAGKFFVPYLHQKKIVDLFIVTLPLEGTKEMKDISDLFLKADYDVDRFVDICLSTPPTIPGGVAEEDASVEAIEVTSLDDVLRERKYIDKKVTVPLSIVSAAERIYHAIRTYKITDCPLKTNGQCCSEDAGERNIPYGHSLFIESCLEKEERVFARLRTIACHNDARCRIEVTRKVVMEEYLATQVVGRNKIDVSEEDVVAPNVSELTHVAVYYLQPDQRVHIEPKSYKATGWIRTHPRNSVATLFIESMIPVEEDFRNFSLANPDSKSAIVSLVKDFKTEEILDDITNGVTFLLHSDDILYAVLLTFLSVEYFHFNGTLIRGWINTIICGDSGVGKSKMYARLSDFANAGRFFSCTTGTRTGLVYATKQKDGEYFTAAGDYVRASGTIIAVDEIQILEREDTRTVANAIDRGVLEVKRVTSGSYTARTRAVWTMNPREERSQKMLAISDFQHGCESLSLVFDPMFIRRMDLAVFRSRREELDYNKFMGTSNNRPKIRLTGFMLQSLIYWAWTRKPDQVKFGEDATRRCLEKASELSAVFGEADKVPLVSPADFRENLARLSVAFAVLDRSFSDDLESVIIKEEHVDMMAGLVDLVYSSPDCNLRELSRQSGKLNRLTDFDGVKVYVESLMHDDMNKTHAYYRDTFPTVRLILLFQSVCKLAVHETPTLLGVDQSWVRRRFTQLQSVNLIKPGERNTFVPTRKFNIFMNKWRESPEIEKLLDTVMQQAAEFAARREVPTDDKQENFTRESRAPF